MSGIETLWYGRSRWARLLAFLLGPVAFLFGIVVGTRRAMFRAGWLRVHHLPVPVVVVGNLTAGGTGKTPVVGWLAGLCREAGYRPGIVSRGYGGRPHRQPRLVEPTDAAGEVGDEPLLLRRQTGVPVCVHPDRVAAGRRLVAEGVNLLIADDGLQHYRLYRDLEIAVVDGDRRLGNGRLLPAGPLREPARRLQDVDLVLVNGGQPRAGEIGFATRIGELRSLDGTRRCNLAELRGRRARVVAGIGNPARFHAALAGAGLDIAPVAVADHGRVDLARLCRESPVPIVMTEKDAVKYAPVAGCEVWVAALEVCPPAALGAGILQRLAVLGK